MSERCPHIVERLHEYEDDRLPSSERREVEMHLQICPDCRRQWREFALLRSRLKAEPHLTPPESFYRGVLEKIRRPEGEPAAPAFSWDWITGLSTKALATVCVLVLIVLTVREKKDVGD